MNILTLDAETFFSDDYTLKKMTTESYIRDPRFEVHGWGVRLPDGDKHWLTHESAKTAFAKLDWSKITVLCHHSQFDLLVLNHVYGIRPAAILDTLSMARQLHGNHLSVSLDALARHYKLAAKTVPYDLFRGKHWHELPPRVQQEVADGCLHDVELTWQIFQEMAKTFPKEEYPIVDLTVRMFTEPALVGDQKLFEKIANDEFLAKGEKLYALGVSEAQLQSADKFCKLLEAEGVEIEMKPGKLKDIPAVAKTDQFMRNLLEDDNERVRDLAQSRLDVRSTLAETRAGRLGDMAQRGPLCVYLSYAGAHTTRWSGGDKINLQNLPRSGDLRRGLKAPTGSLFCSVDQSQGECRILNWLAGQRDVVERFERGEDPYLPMASAFYQRPITKSDKIERQLGKVLELGCGFGVGAAKIKSTLKNAGIELTDDEALRGRNTYRQTHPYVVRYWSWAEGIIQTLHAGMAGAWGPFHIRDGKIFLPNGGWLDYTTLNWHQDEETGERYWRLMRRSGWTKLYGAKLVENVVQALSRVITSRAMLRARAAGYRIVGMSHDDIWVLVPEDGAEKHAEILRGFMKQRPDFGPDLPLDAEAKVGETYS